MKASEARRRTEEIKKEEELTRKKLLSKEVKDTYETAESFIRDEIKKGNSETILVFDYKEGNNQDYDDKRFIASEVRKMLALNGYRCNVDENRDLNNMLLSIDWS